MNVDILKFIQDNIFLVGVAFVSGAMLVWPLVRRGASGPAVSTVEAIGLINHKDALVLDVREAAEYAAGHILNARSLPIGELEARAGELDKFKDRPVIVACATGGQSGGAVTLLRNKGFTQVTSLAGGLAAWKQASLPTEKA